MRAVFIPGYRCERSGYAWKGKPLTPLDPRVRGTGGQLESVIYSAAEKPSAKYRYPLGTSVFGDSGGFSVATKGVELHPVHDVFEWQIDRAHVGPILDIPPSWSVGRTVADAEEEWRYCLDMTVLNTRQALPHYLAAREGGSSFRWWGVVHGRTPEELNEWYDRVRAVYPFEDEGEGWGLKAVPIEDPVALARLLRWVGERGDFRRIHLFAVAGVTCAVVALALGPSVGLEYVSLDASSFRIHGMYRKVVKVDPNGRRWDIVPDREGRAGRAIMLECGCQSCAWLRADLEEHPWVNLDPEKLGNQEAQRASAYWRNRMEYHNVLRAQEVFENLRVEAADDPSLALSRVLGGRAVDVLEAFGRRPGVGLVQPDTPV